MYKLILLSGTRTSITRLPSLLGENQAQESAVERLNPAENNPQHSITAYEFPSGNFQIGGEDF